MRQTREMVRELFSSKTVQDLLDDSRGEQVLAFDIWGSASASDNVRDRDPLLIVLSSSFSCSTSIRPIGDPHYAADR